jgi:hypothetical protein
MSAPTVTDESAVRAERVADIEAFWTERDAQHWKSAAGQRAIRAARAREIVGDFGIDAYSLDGGAR